MQRRFLSFLILLLLGSVGRLWAMSDAQEISIGRQAVAEVEQQYGVYHDPAWEERISRIGAQIASRAIRKVPYTYKIINMKEVNAFALPGGFIYVARGILPFFHNDDQIAAVLGHETSHVELKHFQQMYSRETIFNVVSIVAMVLTHGAARGPVNIAAILNNLVLEPSYSRTQETQADLNGVKLMVEAGYDPNGMIAFFKELEKKEGNGGGGMPVWMQDHPLLPQRIADVQQEINKYSLIPAQWVRNRVIEGEVLPPVPLESPGTDSSTEPVKDIPIFPRKNP